ncbi:MAG: hypothetical protein ACRDT9_10025, partial [Agromyces sp.]
GTDAHLIRRRSSMLAQLARLWRERATPSGFVDFVALFFGLDADERPLLLEHFTIAEESGELAGPADPLDPAAAVDRPAARPGLAATLFVPSYPELRPDRPPPGDRPDGLFARHELRRELIAVVDRYSPAHIDLRVCWVGPRFAAERLAPPDPPTQAELDAVPVPMLGGGAAASDALSPEALAYRQRARVVLANLVSRVDHALGMRVWECIDEGTIDDRLGIGRLPTDDL